jgi:hypothetical protein
MIAVEKDNEEMGASIQTSGDLGRRDEVVFEFDCA